MLQSVCFISKTKWTNNPTTSFGQAVQVLGSKSFLTVYQTIPSLMATRKEAFENNVGYAEM